MTSPNIRWKWKVFDDDQAVKLCLAPILCKVVMASRGSDKSCTEQVGYSLLFKCSYETLNKKARKTRNSIGRLY